MSTDETAATGTYVDTVELVNAAYESLQDELDALLIVKQEEMQALQDRMDEAALTVDSTLQAIEQTIGQGAAAFEQSVLVDRPRSEAWRANVL